MPQNASNREALKLAGPPLKSMHLICRQDTVLGKHGDQKARKKQESPRQSSEQKRGQTGPQLIATDVMRH
jgi:hypothetical protein